MTLAEFATVLPFIPDGEDITITMNAGAWRNAYQLANGGPAIMSTAQAAAVCGMSSRRWREWAKQGLVEGAWQEENGDWRLPREGCWRRIEEEASRGRSRLRVVPEEGEACVKSAPGTPVRKPRHSKKRSIRRGPRQSKAS